MSYQFHWNLIIFLYLFLSVCCVGAKNKTDEYDFIIGKCFVDFEIDFLGRVGRSKDIFLKRKLNHGMICLAMHF